MHRFSENAKKLFIFFTLIFSGIYNYAQINFSAQSDYKYLKGINATAIASNWNQPGFNYNDWQSGTAPFWYGDGAEGTELTEMRYSYSTLYLRSSFTSQNTGLLDDVIFRINYDDGFILWINGQEVLRANAPVILSDISFATDNHESGNFESFILKSSELNLADGVNYIAVQAFNVSLESSDFHFQLSIDASPLMPEEPEYPDSLGFSFSANSGMYSNPFFLTFSALDPAVQIKYTLDCSNPQDSPSALTATGLTTILIDPESSTNRPATPGVILRASVFKEGYKPSKPTSRTFIFLNKVRTQSYPGGDWPAENVNGQVIDLDIDSRIINDPNYSRMIDDAFREIPSMSIVTDIKNLFDPVTGIYVNAMGHGEEWERECSFELLDHKGKEGFGINAGLRIRGGWSRHSNFPKHAFRILFNAEYGYPRLYYPLFEEEGVAEFDNIDLRTSQNYAWAQGDSHNTMVREVFSRDSQRDMGQPYTRSRYYHLYLNGMYWGLFQTQERSESDYASDYFGGSSDDYDVIKVNTDEYQNDIEATDGYLDAWQEIYNRTSIGFSQNVNYFGLQGMDASGKPVKGATNLVDIDNLIDYMLTIFYVGNFDAPVSAFRGNKEPNNFYAIYNRENKGEGFRFFNHDGEHAMFVQGISPGVGLYEDRVNLATRTDGQNLYVGEFKEFSPQWLHHKLSDNVEYRQKFADRAFMHMSEGGALSPEKALIRFNNRASQIDTAIIAESARWGDRNWTGLPYTKNDQWIPELNSVRNDYIPYRTDIVISQLKQANLFSDLKAPIVNNGSNIFVSSIDFSGTTSITLSRPSSVGKLYYSTNGKDPREIGGSISSGAKSSASGTENLLLSTTTILKARIYNSGNWGPLKEVHFLKNNEDYSNLKITELNYHPLDEIIGTDTINGSDYEFIEFKNIGESALNLSGLVLDSAVYYEFPQDEILDAGQFYVICSKPAKFYSRYGMNSSGNFSGNFSNAGEQVLLQDANKNKIIHFEYDDLSPWPEMADGFGYSLVSVQKNPTDSPVQAYYWKGSVNINGSPFTDDPYPDSNNSLKMSGAEVVIYPNPTADVISILVKADDNETMVNIEIYSVTGTKLYHSMHPLKTTLNLRSLNLENGIYIVKLSTSDFLGSYRVVLNANLP
ncbi:MAG: CotH kinase family protein [Bacteroidales bacterium]|nr:CotH kinase family protein [Bacteroidales bacterium]MCF8391974.1 CotH kinase family protein [Bacteroidales bacterium]